MSVFGVIQPGKLCVERDDGFGSGLGHANPRNVPAKANPSVAIIYVGQRIPSGVRRSRHGIGGEIG
jgi:hypothetical protein